MVAKSTKHSVLVSSTSFEISVFVFVFVLVEASEGVGDLGLSGLAVTGDVTVKSVWRCSAVIGVVFNDLENNFGVDDDFVDVVLFVFGHG